MLKVRIGLFETNSSSCHSLNWGKRSIKRKIDKNYALEIVLGTGEYGWRYEELDTWLEKADYLSIDAVKNHLRRTLLESAILKRYPDSKITYNMSGYIDHQSAGVIWSELTNVNDIYDVIFGDSTIIIDNDNH